MKTKAGLSLFTLSLIALLLVCSLVVSAQDNASSAPTVRQAVRFAVSAPVRELAKLPQPKPSTVHEALPVRRIPKRDFGVAVDPVEQNTAMVPGVNYSLGLNFLGVGNGFPGYTVPDAPPDTNMAVGDTQIVQWVNVSFAVFDKGAGSISAGPILGKFLWQALGGPCAANNDGDIIAQWDNAAHRWMLAQNVFNSPGNAPPYYACVAVSTTADALGTYYLYQFPLGNGFPDYPKWGRWTNSWAQTMNNFGPYARGFVGAEVCVYDKTKLLQGNPTPGQVCFQLTPNDDSLLPGDIDSTTPPPAAQDEFFIGSVAAVNTSHLSLYSVHIDWAHKSLATITGANNSQLIAAPTYSGSCNGSFGGDCVPQKGISDKLDSLGDRLMYRFAYYNDPIGGVQHWYVNHAVQASAGQIGLRWYEFQAPQISILPAGLTLFQAGTYAPNSNDRWMGSIAADRNNNILAGYSVSSSTLYPSIAVAGRLKTDALGTLKPELSVVAGTGSQPGTGNRWGDYSSMRIDPDGCTFWYTQEYYQVTQPFDWSTQIASVKFANCQNPAYDGYIELCKQTDPDYLVNGTFDFTLTAPFFSAGPIAVDVGTCSNPIQVPSGTVTITEAPQIGVAVENVTAYSYDALGFQLDELDSWTPPQLTATVTVVPGDDVSLETVATFTNYAAPPGALKVCKIAGPGVTVGTLFNFTATGLSPFQIPAGPPPGGSCQIVGTFPVNTPVTVRESVPAGVFVSNITVNPPNRGGQQTSNSVVVTIGSGFTEVDFTDTASQACGGQSLIIIDQSHSVAYAPIYTPDPTFGDAQIEVVNLPALTFSPPLIRLPGALRPISATYNPNSNPPTMLVEAVLKTGGPIGVFSINTNTRIATLLAVATGLKYGTNKFGGILEDSSARNRAFVAGDVNIGILNQPGSWSSANVVSLLNTGTTDSLSLNLVTDTIFISGDGNNQIIQAGTAPPLVPIQFESDFKTTDGNAWDPFTNILLLSQEVGLDQSWGFNFNTLNTTTNPATALHVQVPGVCPGGAMSCQNSQRIGCEAFPVGEGPGGQTAISCKTHQGLIVDEFGQNFKLIQLPITSPGTSPLDNNGRPFSGTTASPSTSVYTIAEAVIPKGLVNGILSTQLGVVGDPNTVVIDNGPNLAYMLADTCPDPHNWGQNATVCTTPLTLFLVKVDLSSPAVGACPSGITGVSWTPASKALQLQ